MILIRTKIFALDNATHVRYQFIPLGDSWHRVHASLQVSTCTDSQNQFCLQPQCFTFRCFISRLRLFHLISTTTIDLMYSDLVASFKIKLRTLTSKDLQFSKLTLLFYISIGLCGAIRLILIVPFPQFYICFHFLLLANSQILFVAIFIYRHLTDISLLWRTINSVPMYRNHVNTKVAS